MQTVKKRSKTRMAIIACSISLFLSVVFSGCKSDIEKKEDELCDAIEQLIDKSESITDTESAKKSGQELAKLYANMRVKQGELSDLKRKHKKYSSDNDKLKEMMLEFDKEWSRLLGNAEIKKTLTPEIQWAGVLEERLRDHRKKK